MNEFKVYSDYERAGNQP